MLTLAGQITTVEFHSNDAAIGLLEDIKHMLEEDLLLLDYTHARFSIEVAKGLGSTVSSIIRKPRSQDEERATRFATPPLRPNTWPMCDNRAKL
jgi:hypothetical protein